MSVNQIREALKLHGPLTSEQMSQHIGLSRSSINEQSKRLRKAHQIYIIDYKPRTNGTSGRNSPIYALGSRADADDISKRGWARIQTEEAAKPPKKVDTFDVRNPGVRQSVGMWGALMG